MPYGFEKRRSTQTIPVQTHPTVSAGNISPRSTLSLKYNIGKTRAQYFASSGR